MSEDPYERRGPDPTSLNTHSFSTGRLLIEPPTAADAVVLYELVGGPDKEAVTSGLLWDGPDDLSDIEGWIERCRSKHYDDGGFHWVIRDAAGALSGTPGLAIGAFGTRPTGVAGRGDVGYWLGRAYWRRGIMSEVLTGFLKYGFNALDYAKIEAEVFADNTAGIRLAESVGMAREALIRRAHRKRGRWVDAAIYGILYEELA